MAARKIATPSRHRLDSADLLQSGVHARFHPSAESLSSRLALVASTSPGAFYVVSAIIEGILSAVPPPRTDEKVH